MKWEHIHTAADMETELDQEIQKNRTHEFRIRILDPIGQTIPGIKVRAVHQRHDFIFGVCPLNARISWSCFMAVGMFVGSIIFVMLLDKVGKVG